MTRADDRIVLPLSKVRRAAEAWCAWHCRRQKGGEHTDYCLVPDVEQRDRLMGVTFIGGLSPDCSDQFKHDSCTGCTCDCHRHTPVTPSKIKGVPS